MSKHLTWVLFGALCNMFVGCTHLVKENPSRLLEDHLAQREYVIRGVVTGGDTLLFANSGGDYDLRDTTIKAIGADGRELVFRVVDSSSFGLILGFSGDTTSTEYMDRSRILHHLPRPQKVKEPIYAVGLAHDSSEVKFDGETGRIVGYNETIQGLAASGDSLRFAISDLEYAKVQRPFKELTIPISIVLTAGLIYLLVEAFASELKEAAEDWEVEL